MQNKRHSMLWVAALIVLLLVAYFTVNWWVVGRFEQTTDDAYVSGNLVQVMPQLSGNVQAVYTDDTQWVSADQPVVVINGADALLALDKAKTELAQAVRAVQQMMQTTQVAQMQVNQRRDELERARDDLSRRSELIDSRAVAREEVQHARITVSSAQAALNASLHQLAAAQAAVAGTTLTNHPDVLHAETNLRQTWLNVQRSTIKAPVSGYVAKRYVQVGEHVTPTSSLLTIAPPTQMWVDANFKENQLQQIRIGQSVTFYTDMYGKDVVFHGKVLGVSAGTGNVFSLLPPQNATGNWIKVVQRLPVRITLNTSELSKHPLRLGMSAMVTVDVHHQQGPMLATAQPVEAQYQTQVFIENDQPAKQMIDQIIKNNTHS